MTANVPSYIASAKPVPLASRAPWYKNTAPTYAGIFLWFVFWDSIAQNGLTTGGLGAAFAGIVLAAAICHFLFYLVPGLLGLQTGLPLYVVGTSTFGATGGLLMPGLLMGLLQFGWLGVSTYAAAKALAGSGSGTAFYAICVVWAGGAAFIGLKGIQYVSKVATFLPIIPLIVLVLAFVKFSGPAGSYSPPAAKTPEGLDSLGAILTMVATIVGFFATAGAAGVDFGMNNRSSKDVHLGGLAGIFFAIVFTAGISLIAVAGAQASNVVTMADKDPFNTTTALGKVLGSGLYSAIMIGLAIASFPGACFSSFIAANSFKTVMPNVNSFASVGLGALISIILAVTGWASDLTSVFIVIGASFGPIVGAMTADYLLAGRKWAGPRAGWNAAGWCAWLVGFIVGILPNLQQAVPSLPTVPCAPVAAFVVGFVVYLVLALAGLEGEKLALEEGPKA